MYRYEDVIFDSKNSFKYYNKLWEENLLYFCNELLADIWSNHYNIADRESLDIINDVLEIISSNEYQCLFSNLSRETH